MHRFGPEIDHANEDIKHRRQALKRSFTAPGEPGAMFRGVYDKLIEELVSGWACQLL
jgi:hypothetical protein